MPMKADAGNIDAPWFVNHAPNELKTGRTFSAAIRELFVSRFEAYGFHEKEEFLHVRKRGEIYDCINSCHDEVGTFFRVKAYIWSDRFESDEWSSFSEFIDYFIPKTGRVGTSDFINNLPVFDDLLNEVSDFVMQFENAADYIDYVGEHGNWFAGPRYQKIKSMIE